MKKIIASILFLFVIGIGSSHAQLGGVLDQVKKNAQTGLSNAQKQASASALSKIDAELMKKFGLDGAKTSVVGNTLKVLVADHDFTSLNADSKSKTASAVNTATKSLLSKMSPDLLKTLGLNNLNTVVVEMVNKVGNTASLKDTFTFKK
jgi:hypothetical protein